MPNLHSATQTQKITKSMSSHNYIHNDKLLKTIPQQCITLWNRLTKDIKNMAYNDTNSIKQFTNKAKIFIMQNF